MRIIVTTDTFEQCQRSFLFLENTLKSENCNSIDDVLINIDTNEEIKIKKLLKKFKKELTN